MSVSPDGSPSRLRTLRGRLAGAGLAPERAERRLADAGLTDDPDLDALLSVVSAAAAPEDAWAVLTDLAANDPELFAEVRAEDAWLARVVAVAGTSRPLGDLIARFADAAMALKDLRPLDVRQTARQIEWAVATARSREDRAAGIARIQRRATAVIAARDLTGKANVEEVGAQLAGLAEAVLTGTLRALHRDIGGEDPAARIGVVGMGKLGGHELNYVSDVDVIFVHAPTAADADAGDADGDDTARDEARRVLEELLALLNASTTMGRIYEVDPTLRPEGRSGPLSRTIESYVAYWERWAKTWEFQALLKARPVAGDRALCEELLDRAEPFVYPDELAPGVVDEIREMKGRVEAKPEVRRHGERQVKLGPGGLRDIEFAVQLLQLVHGRADRSLRVTGTLEALRRLAADGYVADEDAETFADAYRQLRVVEHRLQLAHERRTHTIPDDPDRQEWLARTLGYRPSGESPAREAFLRELKVLQGQVRELHAKLFYRPLLEAHASVPASEGGLSLPHEVRAMGEDAARTRLAALGFADPRAALRDVRALTTGVSRRATILRAVLPAMLHVLQESPSPDTGLRMFRTLVEAQGRSVKLLSYLRDHPPAADLLARVLGTSEVAGELLVSQPQGIDWLRDAALRETPRTRDELVRAAMGRLGWQDRTAALRRFKRHELLRIVLRDLADAASVTLVGEELTALGEACLQAALRGTQDEVAVERGLASGDDLPVRIAIIGMGKLGGHELHYASDLNVVFVHEAADDAADPQTVRRLAATIAERTRTSLSEITAEGSAFDVDTDLRPEGRAGPLSRSLDAFAAYYERWSQEWEHQALLKARFVAGDADLGRRFTDMVADLAYPSTFDDHDLARMRKMKARVERERIPRRGDPRRHLKLGPGGLADVEWTVQLLQQQFGARVAVVRTTSTMGALDGLEDADLLDHQDATWLRDGYHFLSRLRNRLYLLRQRNVDTLPSSHADLDLLARSLGYGRGGWQELESDHLRHARHVRRVTERLFYGTTSEDR